MNDTAIVTKLTRIDLRNKTRSTKYLCESEGKIVSVYERPKNAISRDPNTNIKGFIQRMKKKFGFRYVMRKSITTTKNK